MNFKTLAYLNQLDNQYAKYLDNNGQRISMAVGACPDFLEYSGFLIVLQDAIKTVQSLIETETNDCVKTWLNERLYNRLTLIKEGSPSRYNLEQLTPEDLEKFQEILDPAFEYFENINTNLIASMRFINTIEHGGEVYLNDLQSKKEIKGYEDITNPESLVGKVGVLNEGFEDLCDDMLCIIKSVDKTERENNNEINKGFMITLRLLESSNMTIRKFIPDLSDDRQRNFSIQEPDLHIQYVQLSSQKTILKIANNI